MPIFRKVAAILNREIAASSFVYADEPVTLDERRRWLAMHREANLLVLIATDETSTVVGWASLSPVPEVERVSVHGRGERLRRS